MTIMGVVKQGAGLKSIAIAGHGMHATTGAMGRLEYLNFNPFLGQPITGPEPSDTGADDNDFFVLLPFFFRHISHDSPLNR